LVKFAAYGTTRHLDNAFAPANETTIVTTVQTVTKEKAKQHLETCVGNGATFRSQQWTAIDRLVNDQARLLIVQRTGWGKSTVYFIATQLLREQGAGPTVIISPLLSLMNNQIRDAESELGLNAVTINSNNPDEWDEATQRVLDDQCDLLLISPERLASTQFRTDVLDSILDRIGLFVVDEAHCISDWGHDFRPDYRRIKQLVEALPATTPVAATTATANDRVVEDVTQQLPGVEPMRGNLVRDSLRIQALNLGSRTTRLAWLAENLPERPEAGIVYCLTTNDVETVGKWLRTQGYDAREYHGRLSGDRRRELEEALLDNEMDVVVATNALGMGFNKPDLGFVIHYQRPPNIIRYYQEIGRAGRNLDEAYAVLLSGNTDDEVVSFFIENAFPESAEFQAVQRILEESREPLYKYEILKRINVSSSAVDTCLKTLQIDGVVTREDDGFVATGKAWEYDEGRIERVTSQRRREFDRIKEFVDTDECLTRFIDDALDGRMDSDCGYCANCAEAFFPETVSTGKRAAADEFYRTECHREIEPRKRIPEKHGTYRSLDEADQLEHGWALGTLTDPGWGRSIQRALAEDEPYPADLVEAAASLIETRWAPNPSPAWVTSVPNASAAGDVETFAAHLAEELNCPYDPVVSQQRSIEPQASLENSYQQCWNVRDAYAVSGESRTDPVLLVDDVIGSRWTLTEVGRCLLEAGTSTVYPFALVTRR
jgi:ATP-dependent DNA helicase RecQ